MTTSVLRWTARSAFLVAVVALSGTGCRFLDGDTERAARRVANVEIPRFVGEVRNARETLGRMGHDSGKALGRVAQFLDSLPRDLDTLSDKRLRELKGILEELRGRLADDLNQISQARIREAIEALQKQNEHLLRAITPLVQESVAELVDGSKEAAQQLVSELAEEAEGFFHLAIDRSRELWPILTICLGVMLSLVLLFFVLRSHLLHPRYLETTGFGGSLRETARAAAMGLPGSLLLIIASLAFVVMVTPLIEGHYRNINYRHDREVALDGENPQKVAQRLWDLRDNYPDYFREDSKLSRQLWRKAQAVLTATPVCKALTTVKQVEGEPLSSWTRVCALFGPDPDKSRAAIPPETPETLERAEAFAPECTAGLAHLDCSLMVFQMVSNLPVLKEYLRYRERVLEVLAPHRKVLVLNRQEGALASTLTPAEKHTPFIQADKQLRELILFRMDQLLPTEQFQQWKRERQENLQMQIAQLETELEKKKALLRRLERKKHLIERQIDRFRRKRQWSKNHKRELEQVERDVREVKGDEERLDATLRVAIESRSALERQQQLQRQAEVMRALLSGILTKTA